MPRLLAAFRSAAFRLIKAERSDRFSWASGYRPRFGSTSCRSMRSASAAQEALFLALTCSVTNLSAASATVLGTSVPSALRRSATRGSRPSLICARDPRPCRRPHAHPWPDRNPSGSRCCLPPIRTFSTKFFPPVAATGQRRSCPGPRRSGRPWDSGCGLSGQLLEIHGLVSGATLGATYCSQGHGTHETIVYHHGERFTTDWGH